MSISAIRGPWTSMSDVFGRNSARSETRSRRWSESDIDTSNRGFLRRE